MNKFYVNGNVQFGPYRLQTFDATAAIWHTPSDRLRGLSAEQASREGARLIERAAKTGAWCVIVDDLVYLKWLATR